MEYPQYLQLVATTNYKQRVRKTLEYFHADRMNYAVIDTPNLLEYEQGFIVNNGDGSADIKSIAHLNITQGYAMAKYLRLPEAICNGVPTTDTYSLSQWQDEFYFALPYVQVDVALWCYRNGKTATELAIERETAEFVYKDVKNKRRMAECLIMSSESMGLLDESS